MHIRCDDSVLKAIHFLPTTAKWVADSSSNLQ